MSSRVAEGRKDEEGQTTDDRGEYCNGEARSAGIKGR